MNELIRISVMAIDDRQIQTVSARDLHVFLEIGKDFSTWVKAQIDRARLLEGRDFIKEINVPQKGERQNQGLSRTEYHLSLDAAKHIGMLSGTEKGFQIREYFLECERRAVAAPKMLTPAEQLLAVIQLSVDQERRMSVIEQQSCQALAVSEEARELAAMAEAKSQASTNPFQDYSIVAWANHLGVRLTRSDAIALGKRATYLSKKNGSPIGQVSDSRYHTVQTYMEDILEEVFDEYLQEEM